MPLAQHIHISADVTLGVWRLTETSAELAALLQRPELYAAKVAGLKPESRRLREILAARCLLRAVTGREWAVAYDADGRPYDADGGEALSISHTEGHVAVIVSKRLPRPDCRPSGVGVDIERLGHRVARVAERFLVPPELALLAAAEPRFAHAAELDAITLHLAWSAKETAYKVLGTTYYDLQHRTTVAAIDPDRRRLTMRAADVPRPLDIAYHVAEDYVLTYWHE
jgi:phosphopantetheinyl transferase